MIGSKLPRVPALSPSMARRQLLHQNYDEAIAPTGPTAVVQHAFAAVDALAEELELVQGNGKGTCQEEQR